MMKILDWYLARTIFKYTTMVMFVLVGLFMFIQFLDEITRVGTGNYGFIDMVIFLVLSTPRVIYEIFPMSALLGTMLGLSSLAVDSELIVMRAAGMSIMGIAGSVMKSASLIILTAVVIGEFISPYAETQAQRGRSIALQKSVTQHSDFGLWMRDDNSIIQVGEMLPDLSLLNIKIFEFDGKGNGTMKATAVAESGKFENNQWVLYNLRQSLFVDKGIKTIHLESANWHSSLGPEVLKVFLVRPEQLSALDLSRYIKHLQENSQNTERYELAFWQKISSPLAIIVMVLLGIPFVFRSVRSGGVGGTLFLGIMLGLIFFAMAKGFGFLVLIYGIPPLAGAFIPLLLFLIVSLVMLKRVA
ncbi:MAG: LPS export ABC transporter permease LptG [Gammaproteobacteria bacterium]|nr:LPS export ABC transporter permease LptG [Gammaproteobacteria bacterium]